MGWCHLHKGVPLQSCADLVAVKAWSLLTPLCSTNYCPSVADHRRGWFSAGVADRPGAAELGCLIPRYMVKSSASTSPKRLMTWFCLPLFAANACRTLLTWYAADRACWATAVPSKYPVIRPHYTFLLFRAGGSRFHLHWPAVRVDCWTGLIAVLAISKPAGACRNAGDPPLPRVRHEHCTAAVVVFATILSILRLRSEAHALLGDPSQSRCRIGVRGESLVRCLLRYRMMRH